MKEPLTEQLLDELINTPAPSKFYNSTKVKNRSLSDYLQQLAEEKGLKRVDIIKDAGLNATFGYQVFMGQRGAGRDKVLQLAFAMNCSLKEANRLLQAAGANELYCKHRRDAIIIYCLTHGATLQQTNEELYHFKEKTLGENA